MRALPRIIQKQLRLTCYWTNVNRRWNNEEASFNRSGGGWNCLCDGTENGSRNLLLGGYRFPGRLWILWRWLLSRVLRRLRLRLLSLHRLLSCLSLLRGGISALWPPILWQSALRQSI